MAGEQDIIRLPYRITDFNEDLIPLLNRNFAEIERMLSQLQLYEKNVGKPTNETVDSITDNNGNVLTDKLSDKIVGLNHELQIAEQAVTTAKVALKAITEALLSDGSVTNLKLAAGAVTAAKTNWQTHLLSDYGIADNTPMIGFVSWSGVKIVYKGVEYSVSDGSTDKLYIWWDFDYPTIMQTAQILPAMTDDDALVFLNKNGTHLVVPKATIVDGSLLVSESVLTDALAANAVTSIKIAAEAVLAVHLAAKSVTAEKINVDNLAAITANLGTINAGYIQVGPTTKNIAEMATEADAQAAADDVRYDGQVVNDANVTAYFPFDDSLYDSKGVVAGTFSRTSAAYLPNGVSVISGIARYDAARIIRGILIEEGTTNLLTANQSSVETDLTGFQTIVGGTLTRDITTAWHGTACLKMVTPGVGVNEGFYTDFVAVAASGTYTASVWLKGSGVVRVYLREQDSVGALIGDTLTADITLTNMWTRHSITRVFGSTGVRAQIHVRTVATAAITYYADGLQLEQKPCATSWTLGGTTRAGETLTIPTAGVFNKGNWAVDITYIPHNANFTTDKRLFRCVIDGNNQYQMQILATSGYPGLLIVSGGVSYEIIGSTAIVAGNKYVFTASGNGTTLSFFCNGVQIGSIPYVEPTGTLPSVIEIGHNGAGGSFANGIIDELRFSKVVRTLEEHQAYYNSNKGFTDVEPIVRPGQDYSGFMITQEGGAKAYHSDGSYTQVNHKGVDVHGGNIRIYDDNNNLVMDGKGVNPLEVSGWGITSGLTFAVQSLTPTSSYVEVITTSAYTSNQAVPFNLYLNDVSKLGTSGKLRTLNSLLGFSEVTYNAVDTVNKFVTVSAIDGAANVDIGNYLFATYVNGVAQPSPRANANLLIKAGSAILRNGVYVKFPNDINYIMPVSVGFTDIDGWQYRVLFVNGNGQITHLDTGTAGGIDNRWKIDNYPAHPRYNNIGTGTPDPNCIVLGAILCGGNKTNQFGAYGIMHPDFRDERALKVNNLVYALPAYYGDIDTIEKSVLTTSAVSVGSWTASSLNLTSGQKYEVAVPIGKGKRMAIVSFASRNPVNYYDDSPNYGAVIFVGLRDPYEDAWQPNVSVGYGNYFIDSFYTDAYGNYVVHESSMGWSYRRITDAYLEIGVDGETYLHFTLYQRTSTETRDIRANWFAF